MLKPAALMLTAAKPAESPAAAVVWAVAAPYPNPAGYPHCNQESGAFCLGYLMAYSLSGTAVGDTAAGTLSSGYIWPSSLPTVPDFAASPFAIPTAVHGHVYVPTFGLCSQLNGSTCTGGSYTRAGIQVYGFYTKRGH